MPAHIRYRTRVDAWVSSRLLASAAITADIGADVYQAGLFPDTIPARHIAFQATDEANEVWTGNHLISINFVYIVRAVAEGTAFEMIEGLADAILVALDGATGATSEMSVTYCIARAGIGYPEVDGERRFVHLGNEFEIRVSPV